MTNSFFLPVPGEPLPLTYARFREAGPVVRVTLPGEVAAWAVTTHDAIREVFAGDNKTYGKHYSHWAALQEGRVPADWPLLPLVRSEHMLMRDGAAHRRLRGLLSKAFTRARIDAMRPWIGGIVDELLNNVTAEGADGRSAVDLVPHFTEALPIAVICQLFGVPQSQRPSLREWTRVLVSQAGPPEEIYAAHRDLVALLERLVEDKRREPGEDLTTALVRAHDDEDSLSTEELVDSLFLLLIAGHETTVHLLGHAIVNVLKHPDQLMAPRRDGLWDDLVEETLRLNPPISGVIFRYTLAPTEIAGVSVPAGEPLLLCIGGAATDPARYGLSAAKFDAERADKGHLSFGHGVHNCLGAPLARMEGRIALAMLFERFPNMAAAVPLERIEYSQFFLTHGPLVLPVLPFGPNHA
ncbi:cytochrome P450 [Bradyrhizobium tropiciagri]|uniref:cytochrome P450 family protein n=1 Tax=Bradyrhizobium tropiciagri TaxID=312253 RepID=UPI001BA7C001|nr:cytochrome P450 [Bradyrhizobium tropiciagri]MBR0873492.1 cytochrome P450 [Bradyrhizobium tropiciagri]